MNDHVDRSNREFCTALAAGDAHGVAAVYTRDARLLAPGSDPLAGTGAIAAFWAAGIAAWIRGAELTTISVEQHDDIAIEVGRYALQIQTSPADALTDTGKYVVLHRLTDSGAWRWDLDIFNSDSPGT